MAAQPLGFTMLDETNSIKQRNNKTIRKKRSSINSSKVTQFLNFMKNSNDDDNKNESNKVNLGNKANSLEDSNKLMPNIPNLMPQIPRMPQDKKDSGYPDKKSSITAFDEDEDSDDEGITTENFDMLETGKSNEDYYKQFVIPKTNSMNSQYMASYNNMTTTPALASNSDPNNLMKKLNYMIHLLEEQQDEKTENVTEELVLYLFLGVFVIFVCDSFARAGKYKR